MSFCNPAYHNRFAAAGRAKGADPLIEASDAYPAKFVTFLFQFRPGMSAESNAHHAPAGSTGTPGHQQREHAFSGDET